MWEKHQQAVQIETVLYQQNGTDKKRILVNLNGWGGLPWAIHLSKSARITITQHETCRKHRTDNIDTVAKILINHFTLIRGEKLSSLER